MSRAVKSMEEAAPTKTVIGDLSSCAKADWVKSSNAVNPATLRLVRRSIMHPP